MVKIKGREEYPIYFGSVHDDAYQSERDKERTKILQKMGLTEIRFRNEEVYSNIEDVLTKIAEKLS
jgi:very-short-patch-repair endonuclease